MEATIFHYSPSILMMIAAASVITLLTLIMFFKMHAFIALTLVSLGTALATKVPFNKVVSTLTGGFGSTLASVALLVGFGAMIGRMLEATGGAKVLADTLINRFGSDRAPFALGIASLLFGFPIFFDAGLIVMLPIIFSVAKRFGGSTLKYALPSAGAFAVMHAFVPPHPGPVTASAYLNVDLGLLTIIGLIISIPTWYFSSYLYGLWAGKKFFIPLPKTFSGQTEIVENPPTFTIVLSILLLPLLLIFLDTGLNTLISMKLIEGDQVWVNFLRMIGKTPIALLLTVLFSLAIFSKHRTRLDLEKICNDALAPICAIILITGAGGMFGGVLRASGIGDAIATTFKNTEMPVIVAAFLIATILRVAQGSATVALTTTAALIAPIVASSQGLSQFDLCFIVIAIASGATVLSHVNDSGFWLVSRFLEMDEKTTFKTWTVMETLIGIIGFGFALLGSLVL